MSEPALLLMFPSGHAWDIADAREKLALRASLPGARTYDACVRGVQRAMAAGVAVLDLLPLTFSASWLVNSPAHSHRMRLWLDPPARDAWLGITEAVCRAAREPVEIARCLDVLWPTLGEDDAKLEALTKVLALLAPHDVPHMTRATCELVLGAPPERDAFARFLAFWRASEETAAMLADLARAEGFGTRAGAVLDRLLWFDAEGYRHFEGTVPA